MFNFFVYYMEKWEEGEGGKQNVYMKIWVEEVQICENNKLGFLITLSFYLFHKVISPNYSKLWLYTVAHTIDCVCSKILNHRLNHGLLFSLFKFFGWKNILN